MRPILGYGGESRTAFSGLSSSSIDCGESIMQEQRNQSYPANTGPHANLSEDEKRQRLDAMVRIWQSDTEKRIEREGYRSFLQAVGLDEYRYSIWLRFPEWERSAGVGQVITLRRSESGAPEDPALFTA